MDLSDKSDWNDLVADETMPSQCDCADGGRWEFEIIPGG